MEKLLFKYQHDKLEVLLKEPDLLQLLAYIREYKASNILIQLKAIWYTSGYKYREIDYEISYSKHYLKWSILEKHFYGKGLQKVTWYNTDTSLIKKLKRLDYQQKERVDNSLFVTIYSQKK